MVSPADAHGLPDLNALWDYDDPAGTEERFRAVLAEAEASGDRSYHGELLTQIARTQALRRRFDAAHATLDEAEAMIAGDRPRARVRYQLERGRTLSSSERPEEARPLFLKAWDLARRSHLDGLAVDAAHMMGITEPAEASLEWNERALALAESSSDPDARRWKGSLCNNIGWTHHDRGEHARALELFEAALAHRREQGKAKDVRVARWCVARCLRSLARPAEALAIQRELEAEVAETDAPDGFVEEEIAECLHALGDAEEARPRFRRAHELLASNPWLAESDPARIERLRRLGEPPGG
ncbi:MAG: tetratricopeptide repeat protein [Planctomycetota bacterium]|jgi:tetratricopeptide (TPR) repeat protein